MKYFRTIMLCMALVAADACRKIEPCGGIAESRDRTSTSHDSMTKGILVKIPQTKGIIKDEDMIWDLNIYVFDGYGTPFIRKFIRYDNGIDSDIPIDIRLLKGCAYSFYIIANTGFDMGAMSTEQLDVWKLYISRPEGNIRGMPMSCRCNRTVDAEFMEMPLQRLMCKVSLELDTGLLDAGISFSPAVARIGNCPRCVQAFATDEKGSSVGSSDDFFITGYSCDWLRSTTLYCLENRAAGDLSTYVEVEIDYQSEEYESHEKGLIYRFHIGGDDSPQAVRSCHYHICVKPRGDGLGNGDIDKNDSWRVDSRYLYKR